LEHKFHRVTPIDRSYDRIEKDIDTMNRLINREMDAMRKANEKLVDGLLQEENDAHECLAGLVEIYEECHRRL
jgi:phage shock protein A